jgi:hypothetical protein
MNAQSNPDSELFKILDLADHLVFQRTKKHLDDLQRLIFQGSWHHQKYEEIAEAFPCSDGHAKDVGYALWHLLSDILGEKVTKSNFQSVLVRHHKEQRVTEDQNKTSVKAQNSKIDWEAAADPSVFLGREEELTILKKWICEDSCRLVSVLGVSGIGKSLLCSKLAHEIAYKFDYVIWRSLRQAPPVNEFLADLIKFFSNTPVNQNNQISQLMQILRSQRCLIVIEDIQSILSTKELAGNYGSGYEGYGEFFQCITESKHQSCMVLTTWENPKEIAASEGKNRPVRSLRLSGLDMESGKQIFRDYGLENEDNWEDLIARYKGHPIALKLLANMIEEVFDGSVLEFSQNYTLFLGDLNNVLSQQFSRLSDLEMQIMFKLAIADQAMTISKLRTQIEPQLSLETLLKNMESLARRSLIEKIKEKGETLFTLQPVIKKYASKLKSVA